MDLSTVANVATSLTVLSAVAFGVIEMRRARLEREERAARQPQLIALWPDLTRRFREDGPG